MAVGIGAVMLCWYVINYGVGLSLVHVVVGSCFCGEDYAAFVLAGSGCFGGIWFWRDQGRGNPLIYSLEYVTI